MPFSILNLFIQISYRPCAYLNPISQGYLTDQVSILPCSTLYSQRAGTTSARTDARQRKGGVVPALWPNCPRLHHLVPHWKIRVFGCIAAEHPGRGYGLDPSLGVVGSFP